MLHGNPCVAKDGILLRSGEVCSVPVGLYMQSIYLISIITHMYYKPISKLNRHMCFMFIRSLGRLFTKERIKSDIKTFTDQRTTIFCFYVFQIVDIKLSS